MYYTYENKVKTYNGSRKHHKLYIEFINKNINFLYNFYDSFLNMEVVIFPDLSLIPKIKSFKHSNTVVHMILPATLRRNGGLYYPTSNLSKKEIAKLKLLL